MAKKNKKRKNKKYSKKEDDLIRENYYILGADELSKIMGRTKKSIINRVYIIRAETKKKMWTPVEIDYLIEYYTKTSMADFDLKKLSDYLGRHKTTVCGKASELGLTDVCRKNSDSHKLASGNGKKKWHSEHEHPRGMLDKNHSKEVCKKISEGHKGIKLNLSDDERKARSERSREMIKKIMNSGNAFSRTKAGIRKDLGIYMRSNWEANYARILNFENKKWYYEKNTFNLKTEKEGTKDYIIDFTIKGGFVEVKGWLDKQSKKTLKMFKECYPEEFNKTTLVINKRDDKTHKWLKRLGVMNFIFYRDLRNKYRDKIIWEGE